jgi:uncharacterized phage protein (TIGR01671 family)
MRELKFRAWDKDKKVMHYDFQFIKSGDGVGQFILFISDKEDNIVKQQNPYPVDRFEIMQYTELKDKNGKEIYEGDILNKNQKLEVIYHKGSYCIWYVDYWFALNEHLTERETEVIGNKYENPELMEKQK